MGKDKNTLTNNFGAPVDDDQNSMNAGDPGPVLMQDVHLLEKLAHFDRERNPATNLKDPDMFWDFLSLTPESIHQVTILFSDRGTPKTYPHMNGYSSHAFKWYNDKGEYLRLWFRHS